MHWRSIKAPSLRVKRLSGRTLQAASKYSIRSPCHPPLTAVAHAVQAPLHQGQTAGSATWPAWHRSASAHVPGQAVVMLAKGLRWRSGYSLLLLQRGAPSSLGRRNRVNFASRGLGSRHGGLEVLGRHGGELSSVLYRRQYPVVEVQIASVVHPLLTGSIGVRCLVDAVWPAPRAALPEPWPPSCS